MYGVSNRFYHDRRKRAQLSCDYLAQMARRVSILANGAVIPDTPPTCMREITFVDGERGIWRYRAYAIADSPNVATL